MRFKTPVKLLSVAVNMAMMLQLWNALIHANKADGKKLTTETCTFTVAWTYKPPKYLPDNCSLLQVLLWDTGMQVKPMQHLEKLLLLCNMGDPALQPPAAAPNCFTGKQHVSICLLADMKIILKDWQKRQIILYEMPKGLVQHIPFIKAMWWTLVSETLCNTMSTCIFSLPGCWLPYCHAQLTKPQNMYSMCTVCVFTGEKTTKCENPDAIKNITTCTLKSCFTMCHDMYFIDGKTHKHFNLAFLHESCQCLEL